jgi:DNA-binding Lrp family transcriptional regulator
VTTSQTTSNVLRDAEERSGLSLKLRCTLQALAELCDISEGRRSTISQVARATGVSRSAVYGRIRALRAGGWLRRVQTGLGGLRVELATPSEAATLIDRFDVERHRALSRKFGLPDATDQLLRLRQNVLQPFRPKRR